MTVKITGFADEIALELTAQIAGLKGLGMSYVEMRGVDGENLIYHTDEKVAQIKKTLDENGIRLSALWIIFRGFLLKAGNHEDPYTWSS